jgi:hypothetical protein
LQLATHPGGFNLVQESWMKTVQFGGGYISPAIKAHLAKKKVEMGGGIISPAVKAHVAKKPAVLVGGGIISPSVVAHLAK